MNLNKIRGMGRKGRRHRTREWRKRQDEKLEEETGRKNGVIHNKTEGMEEEIERENRGRDKRERERE